MSVPHLPEALAPVLERQLGLLSRAQLAEHGVSAAAVRHRSRSAWRLVLPGVVSLTGLRLDDAQRLVAAQLMCGPRARIAGPTAARWHRLRNVPDDGLVHVHVPVNQAARSAAFVRASRTRRPTPYVLADGVVSIEPAARAVADAARTTLAPRDAVALVIEAVQSGTVRLAELHHELWAGPRHGSATLRKAVEAAATGAWSAPEHDLLVLVGTSTLLPDPWPNPQLLDGEGRPLPTPDLWFDDVGLAVQVHSARHHQHSADWDRTVRTDSALAEAGVLRLSVTPHEIRTEADAVLRRIERLHGSRSPHDRPAVRMIPRDPVRP